MNLLEFFKPIKTMIFDVDGVLTDGSVLVFESGEQVRQMNVKDGYALQLAVKKNYQMVIISGGNGVGAEKRLHKLGLTNTFLNIPNKTEFLDAFLKEKKIDWKEVLYMGDDIPDYGPMLKAAMPCAPADAVPEILEIARYISPYVGGRGCVRDVIEKLLRLHGNWELKSNIASL